ncbi:methylated-DNA--[protein]-cysteine S-methyltransferase [Hydrogenophaga sp. H7]|uniref:methylated-DNA--[protein]-cysteine S-methyltransferase n=1 Tax=Hydrogenophaga sp. H7 TaxID=1882399 RepID=UPI0009A3D7AB|nr:MGMT family protein [Hydrogenophaga sp. H7]OPF65668.1 cysteine methyltransferase [Hydrogenophaga sp. H7]
MDSATGHTLFDTAIGVCGMAWGPAGITAVQLPEPTPEGTRQRLLRSLPEAVPEAEPPPPVQSAITELKAALRGERPADLRHLPLDMSRLTPFLQRVYERTRAIPPGQVLTYGELAAEMGDKHLARAIGQAMGANPFAPVVPCHRVLAAGGQPGGFSASGGAITKWRLLEIEGYRPGGQSSLFD